MGEIHRTDCVVDGIRCVVHSSGPQHDREAIVFVHGNPGSSEDWSELLARAGDFGRAIAPDMPAFGKAERPYVASTFAAEQSKYFRAEIHTLPNAGHWPMVDEPEQVEQWVIPFLQKQLGRESKQTVSASS